MVLAHRRRVPYFGPHRNYYPNHFSSSRVSAAAGRASSGLHGGADSCFRATLAHEKGDEPFFNSRG